jgi:glycosyltransferase involved in cell wall biosynthesis
VSVVIVERSGAPLPAAASTLERDALAALDFVEIVTVNGEAEETHAAAYNRATRRATGEFVAFLDAEARPDADWLPAALRALNEPAVACVASAVDRDSASNVKSAGDGPADVLYARARAMIVDHEVFEEVGGFDASLPLGAAELDFGWRLWVLGYRVRFAPASRVELDGDGVSGDGLVSDDDARRVVRANTEAGAGGDALGARRRRRDHELAALFRAPETVAVADSGVLAAVDRALQDLDVRALVAPRRRVLVASGDVLEPKMAGPAIRAWQIACALNAEHDVELVSTLRCTLTHPDFPVRHVDGRAFTAAIRDADIVIFQGNLMALYPELRTTDRIVIADIYDPFHLEVLEQTRDRPASERRAALESSIRVLNEQLARADFLLCASDKQRDFWLGQLAAVGRINPATYDESENLDTLVAVVPFGVSDEPPHATRPVLKGVVPGIGHDDRVVLWGGGVYNWFDPLTLLRAVDRLCDRVPNVRLFFLGLKHPNPHVGEMRMAVDTRALSDELGLTGVHVFFNEDWVPYEDRQNYLLESDVGVSTHLDHIETAFSFRTRILDYLWAGLPVVATAGDSLAERIEAAGAGFAVPAGDVDALANALGRVVGDAETAAACRRASVRLAGDLRWSRVLEPLLAFCRQPRRAPDLVDPTAGASAASEARPGAAGRRARRDLGILYEYLRRGDFLGLARRAWARVGVILRGG